MSPLSATWQVFTIPLLLAFVLLASPHVRADPEPINDFGKVNATAADFVFHNFSGSVSKLPAGGTTKTTVINLPGVDKLGLTNAIYYFGVNAVLSPHWHPRGSETVYVLEGRASVGFVDTKYEVRRNILETGDITIFPRGLLHWIENIGTVPLKTFHSLDGQDAGTVLLNRVVREIDVKVLKASFNISRGTVKRLKNPDLKALEFKISG